MTAPPTAEDLMAQWEARFDEQTKAAIKAAEGDQTDDD